MIPLQLSAAERVGLRRTLSSTHTKRVMVGVHNLEGKPLRRLTPTVMDGTVNVDATADVTRSLTMALFDPLHQLNFDSNSPDDGALFADRMIRVFSSRSGPYLDDRISVPVFTGPIVDLDRDGPIVNIVAHGKEIFGLGAAHRTLTIPKKTKKTDAIRTILTELMGETRLAIPDRATRLAEPVVVQGEDQPWKAALRIARSMNMQLFYDGRGTARLRRIPRRPVWEFTADRAGATIVSRPVINYDMSQVKNLWVVVGRKPKGAKSPVRFAAIADRSHPLSPWRLGRNDVPRYLMGKETSDEYRSRAECRRRAEHLLEDSLRVAVDVAYDVLPVPHLDPGDLIRVVTADTTVEHRLKKFQYPLRVSSVGSQQGQPMSIGYWKETPVRRKKIR